MTQNFHKYMRTVMLKICLCNRAIWSENYTAYYSVNIGFHWLIIGQRSPQIRLPRLIWHYTVSICLKTFFAWRFTYTCIIQNPTVWTMSSLSASVNITLSSAHESIRENIAHHVTVFRPIRMHLIIYLIIKRNI